MSSASDIRSRREGACVPPLVVDRIACTGHGICASLLPEQVRLDEWGYPIVRSTHVDPEQGDAAIRLCPARALAWHRQQH
ncbi:MAG TPA: ferredoxin [Dermatophilaceae bacterium]|nr:ferredoxin [Dermatophilaceae bacterium]